MVAYFGTYKDITSSIKVELNDHTKPTKWKSVPNFTKLVIATAENCTSDDLSETWMHFGGMIVKVKKMVISESKEQKGRGDTMAFFFPQDSGLCI